MAKNIRSSFKAMWQKYYTTNKKEKNNTLKEELKKIKEQTKKDLKIAIVIGPEGGIEDTEIQELKQNGAKTVTLGERILRTETVALNVLSIVMYEFEK